MSATRSVLLVVSDKTDPAMRVIIPIKSNLSAAMPAVAFSITKEPVLAWQGVVDVDVIDLLAMALPEEQERSEVVRKLLQEILSDGGVPEQDVVKEARECGITEAILRWTTKDMNAGPRVWERTADRTGHWVWILPESLDARCLASQNLNSPDGADNHEVRI